MTAVAVIANSEPAPAGSPFATLFTRWDASTLLGRSVSFGCVATGGDHICMSKTCLSYLETCLGVTKMSLSRSALCPGPSLHVCFRLEGLFGSGALSAKTKIHALQNSTPRSSSFLGYEKLVPKKEVSFAIRATPELVFFR